VNPRLVIELAGIVIATVPVLVLLLVFRRADHARPEPKREVFITMLLGFVACLPAAALEVALKRALGTWVLAGGRFIDAYIVAGLIEEAAKMAVVFLWPWRRRFDEVMDGVVYTSAASLGFGLFENLIYIDAHVAALVCSVPGVAPLCSGHSTAGSSEAIVLGVIRGVTAVPMHAIASGIMGYFIGRARFHEWSPAEDAFDDLPDLLPQRVPRSVAWLFFGLLAAVGVHGTYDWAVFAMGSRPVVFLVLPVILGLSAFALVHMCRHALLIDDEHIKVGGRISLVDVVPVSRENSAIKPDV
jgi:protease PrsW